jgi:hypothetical protein
MAGFIWTDWNRDHATRHGVTIEEAEYVVTHAKPPYPAYQGDFKFLVRGQADSGRYVQVIYVMESDATGIEYAQVDLMRLDPDEDGYYIIHARPLTAAERRTLRRRKR